MFGVDKEIDSTENSFQESSFVIAIIVTFDDSDDDLFEFFHIAVFNQFLNFFPAGELDYILFFVIVGFVEIKIFVFVIPNK